MNKQYPFGIIYEDNHLLVVDKPAGMLVQGDQTNDRPLVDHAKQYIKEKYNKPGKVFLGVVHRLDRPVSGVVVLARTSKALERMNAIFRKREVKKTYWAVVKQKPPKEQDKLVHWLQKDAQKNKTRASDTPWGDARKSELRYRLLGFLNDHYLLQIEPESGRPHQIRVQLAEIGCPIRGDLKYGFKKPNPDGDINLHAKMLRFTHPVKKEPMVVQAGLPANKFWEQFDTLEDVKNDPRVRNKNLDYLH